MTCRNNNEPLLQRIAAWDFDMTDITNWFVCTANYWADKYGLLAYLAVAAVTIIALLAFPLTSKPTSLIVASGIRALFSAVSLVFVGVSIWLLSTIIDLGIARTRSVIERVKKSGKD